MTRWTSSVSNAPAAQKTGYALQCPAVRAKERAVDARSDEEARRAFLVGPREPQVLAGAVHRATQTRVVTAADVDDPLGALDRPDLVDADPVGAEAIDPRHPPAREP